MAAWRGYALMLQGEILAAQGKSPAAVARFQDALAVLDSFQVHESLAHGYQLEGVVEAAITENEWLTQHRGRGVVECLDRCPTLNLTRWSLAFLNLGRLYERHGDPDAASGSYASFLEHWPRDDKLWQEAERRLAALRARDGAISEGSRRPFS